MHSILDHWISRTQLLLDSYQHWTGQQLLPRDSSSEDQAQQLFSAPFVVVSHGTEDNPVLNYGNLVALNLWEMDVATLTKTPSRQTAEPVHRDERAELLRRTTENGFVDDYRGIRISSTGRRFLIEKATVWNLIDQQGNYAGQAATFDAWKFLDED
ncbi:MAG: MEKHLA domain-containing protein [Blastopirellula sp.]|nr:MAG: MEKHLA domain-containing protein [Blastopirellula sp.]